MSIQRTMSGSGRRLVAAGLTAAMALAACGGGDDDSADTTPTTEPPPAETTEPEPPSTTVAPATTEAATTTPASTEPATPDTTEPAEPAEPVTVYSEDGAVALTVSAADAERVNPTVRVLDPSEWPPELGDADQLPGVTIYEMEPDGAEFDEPVVVSRRLDMSAFGDTVDLGSVPLVVPFTQNDEGQFAPLDDLTVSRVGDDLFASGTTTHFSPLGTIDLQMNVTVVETTELARVGATSVEEALQQVPPVQVDQVAQQFPGLQLQGLPPLTDAFQPSGLPPMVTSRSTIPPDQFPTFTPPTVELATESSGLQVPQLRTLITSSNDVPRSPLFDDPLVPDELDVAVEMYLVALEEGDLGGALAMQVIAEELATAAGLRFEVIHTALGLYPSFFRVALSGTQQYEDVSLYAAAYTGDFGPDAQLVDLAPMKWADDAYVADVGLTSYGDVKHGLIVAIEDTRPIEELTPLEYFDQFWSTPEAIMALFVPDPFAITSEEGVIFEGPAGYQIYDMP